MKILDEKDIYQKILAADGDTLLTKIILEITGNKNEEQVQDALKAIEIISRVLEVKQNVRLYFNRRYYYRMLNQHQKALADYSFIAVLFYF